MPLIFCQKNDVLLHIVSKWIISVTEFYEFSNLCTEYTQYYGLPPIYNSPEFSLFPSFLVMFLHKTFTLVHIGSNWCWVDSKNLLLHGHCWQFFKHSKLFLGHFTLLCTATMSCKELDYEPLGIHSDRFFCHIKMKNRPCILKEFYKSCVLY